MPYYLGEIRLNKSNNSENKQKKRKRYSTFLVTILLILLLISSPFILFSIANSAEPTFVSILNDFGFNNIAPTEIETFSSGTYNITLIAEFAGYRDQNELSYYAIETNDFHTIFIGPEGGNGTLASPLSKIFDSDSQFGLSMLSPESHRYFTEHWKNPDYPEQHAKVYKNLDSKDMFLIGFENKFGGFDRDYNDMVFIIFPVYSLENVSVTRSPEIPNYDQQVKVTAKVTRESVDIDFVILSFQIEYSNWVNQTMIREGAFYVSDILSQPYDTSVNYMVYASDKVGNFYVSKIHSYTVGDFVKPVIDNVLHFPNYLNPNEIEVSAWVTEPSIASGVENATLYYKIDKSWIPIVMLNQTDLWKVTIPMQSKNVNVSFFIEAFDAVGNKANTTILDYKNLVPNRTPIAVIMYSPNIAYTDVIINFDGSLSYDPDGTIVEYLWDFGDGNTASVPTVSHSYADNGEYSVTLRIVDNLGTLGSKVAVQVIKNRPPVAALTETAVMIDKKQVVTFDASPSYDPDGTIVEYFWDFEDGTTGTGVSISHSYSESGLYTATLTITDNDGATDTISTTKVVGNKAPIAVFFESSSNVHIEDTITFNASKSYDPDGIIVNYFWDFGDGNTGTGELVSHAYKYNRSYFVTLTVTDNDGATDIDSTRITVINSLPVSTFTSSPVTVNTNEFFSFDASGSYDSDGTIVSYLWDFGDGTTGTGISTQHAYSQDGTFVVILTVTDNFGATDTTSVTKTVRNLEPVAFFNDSAENVLIGEIISFDASGSYDSDGTIVSYLWDFGDGTKEKGVTVAHSYSEAGAYNVTLTITDDDGSSSSVVVEKTVNEESVISLAVLSLVGLGIAALTATLLYGLLVRRKRKTKETNQNG